MFLYKITKKRIICKTIIDKELYIFKYWPLSHMGVVQSPAGHLLLDICFKQRLQRLVYISISTQFYKCHVIWIWLSSTKKLTQIKQFTFLKLKIHVTKNKYFIYLFQSDVYTNYKVNVKSKRHILILLFSIV